MRICDTLSPAQGGRGALGPRRLTRGLTRRRLWLAAEDMHGGGGAAAVGGRARVRPRVGGCGVPHEQVADGVVTGLSDDRDAATPLVVQHLCVCEAP